MPDGPERGVARTQKGLEPTQRDARQQTAFLSQLLEAIPAPVFFKDAAQVYRGCNEAFEHFLGRPREEIVDKTVFEVAPPELAQRYFEQDQALLQDPGVQVYEADVKTGDGMRRVVFHKATFVDADGTVAGLVGVILDITDRTRAEDELRRYQTHLEEIVALRTQELTNANEELARALQAKSRFFANISHELRTPLNSIIGFSAVMLQGLSGALTEEEERQLRMVHHSGEHLLALVNDLLDLSTIESGATRIRAGETSVGAVVDVAVDAVRPLAARRGLRMSVEIDAPDLPLYVDEEKVTRILVSLLGNAVKFTDSGGFTLKATSRDDQTVSFDVIDTGAGIPPEELANVFDEFVQAESIGGKPEGTGLSLPIARKLAVMLGGTLTASSAAGEGSTFTLTIPSRYAVP